MWEEPEIAAGEKPPAIPGLISKALASAAREVDPRLLKAIKSTARSSDAEARAAVPALMFEMHKQNSQVRYLAVLITDELFMRSKLFRSLLVDRLEEFLSLSVGFRSNLPLPPPSTIASALRSKSIELLEKWNDSFGIYYRQLRLGFDYLKKVLHFRFPNRLENETRLQQERREKEARTKEILLGKFDRLRETYSSIKAEIRLTVDEIGECLDILHSEVDDFVSPVDDGVEEFKSLALNQIRQESLKEGEKVRENSDNRAIFEALRESHKLLESKHVPSVKEWISVLVRVDLADNNSRDVIAVNKFRDTALKEFIDLRNLIQSVEERCKQLGCSFDEKPRQEEEEDIWEEGAIEISTPEESSGPNSSVDGSVVTPMTTTNKGKGAAPPECKKPLDDASSSSNSNSGRSKLLDEAPVMTWGPFLDNWGSSRDVLANQRGLELEGHWGRVDYDAVIPAEKIAELNVYRTVYKEQPVEIQPCLAPLKKGGLCQRRDLKVCPFHGPIVPRNAEGNPIQQCHREGESQKEFSAQLKESTTPESDQMNDLLDAERSPDTVLEQLAKQAVKNVREKDREKKSLKRAKLAKVREHNESVLRDAALASTSYSEHGTASHEHENNTHVKRPTSASRLRKKETSKDRIAQRLLNTRVTDASIRQHMEGEHSKYREAFPNQW